MGLETWRASLLCRQTSRREEAAAGEAVGNRSGVEILWASQVVRVLKNPPANAGGARGAGLIPGLGRSPGEGNGNPLQYSCLENPRDGGAW